MDESNISESLNFQNKNSKKIDIFQHLRLNLKTQNKNCKDNNDNVMYCIPCKVTCCPECTLEEHKDHILVSKSRYLLTERNIDNVFNQLNEKIQSNQLFNDYQIVESELIKQIEDMINELKNQIEKLRNLKIREMKNMFENFGKTISGIKNKIDKSKNDLKGYLNKNKKFFNVENNKNNETITNGSSIKKLDFNTNKSNSSKKNSSKKLTKVKNNIIKPTTTNLDENSSLFLIHYELLNLIELKGKDLDNELKTITLNIKEYKENQTNYIKDLLNNIKNLFFGEYNFSKEDYDNMNDIDIKKIIDESSPIYPINISVENLDKENFDEITKRTNQYNILYDSFKKSVFDSVNKYGDLKDIENYIYQFETISNKKDADDMLFTNKKIFKNSKATKSELALLKTKYNNKEEITLNNDILQKYFSFLCLECYEKNFKQDSKELQSSHADLRIKKNEDEEDSPKDYGKAIENTNIIMFYYRKNRQITKTTIELTRNPFGYTKFPIGCRSLLIGDKLYISGGEDETQIYKNVLIYDRLTNKIKRIIDLNDARAYHTMIYCDVFETLMVIGGENCSSVEIFDPVINRWLNLPNLNSPRANIIFQFDKPRGIMYSFFGNIGLITDSNYSKDIEYLDLKDIKKGWVKLNYENKSEIDFKTYLNIVEINNDLILIYGGLASRGCNREISVLNKEKKLITKCDQKMLELMREETKTSKRLSKIVGNLTI
jgi:hypothetical protein